MCLGAVAVLPRCFSRSMSRLTISSVISVVALSVGVLSVVVALANSDDHAEIHTFTVTPKWWLTPGIIVFCFSYPQVTNSQAM